MYTLLDRRVEITTPKVKIHTLTELLSMYQVPFVVVEVEYVEGLQGKNLLLLKEYDAAIITDVLMGGSGSVEEPIELSELHMSAINEIMNQMIGSSATALAKIIGSAVNISTPNSRRMSLERDISVLGTDERVIVIEFTMEIEGLLNSSLIQILSLEQGKEMAALLLKANEVANEAPGAPSVPAPAPVKQAPAPPPAPAAEAAAVQYESFESPYATPLTSPDGLNMVYDIPVQVSVELGKTKKEISEILEFDRGTIVVLEKNAGDPVEVLVNGKLVASGEVVVIEENYGVRITRVYT
jgi:flagellar motor switch protein FliN/FliY